MFCHLRQTGQVFIFKWPQQACGICQSRWLWPYRIIRKHSLKQGEKWAVQLFSILFQECVQWDSDEFEDSYSRFLDLRCVVHIFSFFQNLFSARFHIYERAQDKCRTQIGIITTLFILAKCGSGGHRGSDQQTKSTHRSRAHHRPGSRRSFFLCTQKQKCIARFTRIYMRK